jgi:hypothetical protein
MPTNIVFLPFATSFHIPDGHDPTLTLDNAAPPTHDDVVASAAKKPITAIIGGTGDNVITADAGRWTCWIPVDGALFLLP